MVTHDIRQMLLAERETVKNLILTDQEMVVYNKIRNGSNVGTADISKILNVSAQHASGVLKRIHAKGYLLRITEIAATGGHEFRYSALYPNQESDTPKAK